MPRLLSAPLSLSLALALVACGGDAKTDAKKTDTKTDVKAEPAPDTKIDPATSLDKVATAVDLAGPVPPETSAVIYSVDGALLPIGCFNKDKKKLGAGKDCGALAKLGDEVYLKSKDTEKLDKIGAPKDSNCEPGGGGTPTSLSVPVVDAGTPFEYAVVPKSLARQIVLADPDSTTERKPALAEAELAAIKAIAKVEGDLTISQVLAQDIDGDNTPDKIVSVFQINPKDSERFSFAGVLVSRGSAPGTWITVESNRNDTQNYTVRATVDLDGDRSSELWLNAVTTEGAGGDRIYQLTATGATALGKWTCGV